MVYPVVDSQLLSDAATDYINFVRRSATLCLPNAIPKTLCGSAPQSPRRKGAKMGKTTAAISHRHAHTGIAEIYLVFCLVRLDKSLVAAKMDALAKSDPEPKQRQEKLSVNGALESAPAFAGTLINLAKSTTISLSKRREFLQEALPGEVALQVLPPALLLTAFSHCSWL